MALEGEAAWLHVKESLVSCFLPSMSLWSQVTTKAPLLLCPHTDLWQGFLAPFQPMQLTSSLFHYFREKTLVHCTCCIVWGFIMCFCSLTFFPELSLLMMEVKYCLSKNLECSGWYCVLPQSVWSEYKTMYDDLSMWSSNKTVIPHYVVDNITFSFMSQPSWCPSLHWWNDGR